MPIHDWTIEETLSALVMQAELLLISRNMTLVSAMLPLFLRTSNLLESRRDSTTNMFLTGLVCIFLTLLPALSLPYSLCAPPSSSASVPVTCLLSLPSSSASVPVTCPALVGYRSRPFVGQPKDA